MTEFNLTQTDGLLTTTKQVRKRLDFDRAVPRQLLLDCIEIASRAPMGGNLERNKWLVIDDPDLKAKVGELYLSNAGPYLEERAKESPEGRSQRVFDSAMYLAERMGEVPAMVIPIRLDRLPEGTSVEETAGYYGSVLPGAWSFQLAARSRGLGSCWTTLHLGHEAETAELLGIPDTVTQVALFPVAYYTGDTFRAAPRRSAEDITFFNTWGNTASA
ncbi:MAG: nitroreductase family protein [Acidimicrobiales bacterium]|nr:MAG: nitroreductase family protein [Acidimicrobiales bacterium]